MYGLKLRFDHGEIGLRRIRLLQLEDASYDLTHVMAEGNFWIVKTGFLTAGGMFSVM